MSNVLKGAVIKGGGALVALLLSACVPMTSAEEGKTAGGMPESKAAIGANAEMPVGAESFKEGAYAAPHSVDSEGCELFTIWRPDGFSQRTLYFRSEEALFSPRKSQAICDAVMEEAGADAEGCPTFRATRKSGGSSDVVYYLQAPGLYTVTKASATCS